jgi:AcrR family transcriptional regulator
MAIRKKGAGAANSSRRTTDEDMLAGIRRVIARRGVEETRFSDVATETNVALSTLQYRFGNWEGMILAALRHENQAELERVTRVVGDAADPVQALRRMLLAAVWADASAPEAREGSLVWTESWRIGARDPDLRAEWRSIHDQWCHLIERTLVAGEQAGSMTLPHGARTAALQLLAVLDGLHVPLVLEKPETPPAAIGRLMLDAAALIVACPELRDPEPV